MDHGRWHLDAVLIVVQDASSDGCAAPCTEVLAFFRGPNPTYGSHKNRTAEIFTAIIFGEVDTEVTSGDHLVDTQTDCEQTKIITFGRMMGYLF